LFNLFKSYILVPLLTPTLALTIKNQTLHYTRHITPKRVTSWRCLSPRHSAKATQLPA